MKEIKFRGKSIKTGNWLFGDLVQDLKNNRCAIVPQERVWQVVDYEVDPESVGQYTGLKDKNGVEIYEGDIVRVSRISDSVTALVSFDYCGLVLETELYRSIDFWTAFDKLAGKGFRLHDLLEVIGNIYENPELIGWKTNETN